MVTTQLMGGLGNYMFQIAAAISLSIDNKDNTEFYLRSTTQVHKHILKYSDNILRYVNIVDKNMVLYNIYDEPSFTYNEIPYHKDLLLKGYFQSEKYFKHNRQEIISTFAPTTETISQIQGKYGQILSLDNTCSIHVRRGDYVKLSEHHPPCTMEYYNNAMSKMSKGVNYLIFSDDIEWCKKHFIGDEFTFIENEVDVVDLHLMSLCKHNIIANSSFSWWGAWLNNNKDKIVIAPDKWFGPAKGNIKTDDIYADKWVTL